ncbi:MAG: hypothetical protein OXJ90_14555 [Spirochaetaceae bacterium]|nr:hypothetical protein [Spirochaetaceae bacterium]
MLKQRGKGLEAKRLHSGKQREYLTHQEYRPYLDLPDETLSREVSVIAARCAKPEHEIWGEVLNGGLHLLDQRLQGEFSEYAERRKNPRRPSLQDLYRMFGLSDLDTRPLGQSTRAPTKGSVK